jgi:anti-sigma B factor antagonist
LRESQHDLASPKINFTGLGGYSVEIEIRHLSQVKLIKLTGRLTLGVPVDRLRDTFQDLAGSGAACFILDLADVDMIDSSGLGLLVRYLTTAKQQGGTIKLLNPSKFSIKVMKMMGILNLFEVFQDQTEALASFP